MREGAFVERRDRALEEGVVAAPEHGHAFAERLVPPRRQNRAEVPVERAALHDSLGLGEALRVGQERLERRRERFARRVSA